MNKEKFQALVRRILTEEITKRVPEMNNNGVVPETKDREKTFSSDPNSRDAESKDTMMDQMATAVKGVDPSYTVVWNDHDDIHISGRDMVDVMINPLWEDNYRIIFLNRNEDRFFFTGLSWKQVLDFVKNNLKAKHIPTGVEQARDKSWRNNEAKPQPSDSGIPQDDKPKIKPLTNEPPKKEKNKEKDYTIDDVKNKKDLPIKPDARFLDDQPDATKFKRQEEFKPSEPVHPRGKPVMGKKATYKNV